MTENSTFL